MPYVLPVSFPCPTCCGGTCTEMQCRRRGGEARLCGHREYGEASVPPRFYLEEQIGGSVVVCNHLSPPGPQCADDSCPNPIGLTWEISATYTCSPGATAKSLYAQLSCTGAVDVGGGNVRLDFSAYSTATGGAGSSAHSWIIYINGILAGGSFSGPGSTSFSSIAPNGSNLSVALTIDNNGCSRTADPPSGSPNPVCFGSSCSAARNITWCVPRGESTRHAYSGSSVFNPYVNCLTPVDNRKMDTVTSNLGCNPPLSGGTVTATATPFDPALSAYVEQHPTLWNKTVQQQQSNGACSGDVSVTHCDRFRQLNLEDTDEDARDRLLSGPGGDWADWRTVGDGTGGTCVNPPCCMAVWGIRTDQTYDYFEAEFRAIQRGLPPGSTVDMVVRIWRRPAGSSVPYTWFQDYEYDDVTVNESGEAIVEGTVPNAEGFETVARCLKPQGI